MENLSGREILNIVEGLAAIWGAWFFNQYRTGRLKLPEKLEAKRKEKVKKYEPLLLLGIFACLISGIVIIVFTLIKI